ncbi:hypothetical protein Cgig2_016160 [Carnegiea gigantea]|uniref:Uncharacterized protein n=1 Tax=Carnegiea gigantea TaxID=171969 RepID=A0A9Q1QNS1_9CARY|nr:hypothetical protein Cgig2_016160 [Carnegiea gigantea]
MPISSRRISAAPPPQLRPKAVPLPRPPVAVRFINSSTNQQLGGLLRLNYRRHIAAVRSDAGEKWRILERRNTTSSRCKCVVREGSVDREEAERDRPRARLVVAAAATVVLGVGNRVLYKLALVPLKQYPFFLAQLATFGYVVVYFSILYIRHHAGIVTQEMLSLPQAPYLAVGLLEALAGVSGMAATSEANLLFCSLFFHLSLTLNALWCIHSNSLPGNPSSEVSVCIAQALFIGLLLPFLSKLWGIPFSQLPSYLKDGAACFLNVNSLPSGTSFWLSAGCDGAPLLPVLFVIVNMCYNVSLLYLLKISSALVTCLASTVTVPLSVFVFTMPLPYLGAGTSLPPGFLAGLVILVLGLLSYAWRPAMVPASATT